MAPSWLRAFADVYVPLSILTAALVLGDIVLLGRRQRMAIMDIVWPLTMLYWGPLGLPTYAWFGRAGAGQHASEHDHRPMWQAVFLGATHCGAGCALGDCLGDWIAFFSGLSLFGSEFGGKLLLSFLLAFLFGIEFQYFSVAPMRGLGLRTASSPRSRSTRSRSSPTRSACSPSWRRACSSCPALQGRAVPAPRDCRRRRTIARRPLAPRSMRLSIWPVGVRPLAATPACSPIKRLAGRAHRRARRDFASAA